MDLSKRRSLMKAFVTSQFNYCPLIWMFHFRELSNRINRIHGRALRLAYQGNSLSFPKLLEKDKNLCDKKSKKSTSTCYPIFCYPDL